MSGHIVARLLDHSRQMSTASIQQFGWLVKLHDPSPVHDDDFVTLQYGIESMSDGQYSAVFELVSDGLLDQSIGGFVHIGRRLIQNQNPVVLNYGSSQAEQLSLTDTEISTTVVKPRVQRRYRRLQVNCVQRRPQQRIIETTINVQVLANRSREDHGFLRNYGDPLS